MEKGQLPKEISLLVSDKAQEIGLQLRESFESTGKSPAVEEILEVFQEHDIDTPEGIADISYELTILAEWELFLERKHLADLSLDAAVLVQALDIPGLIKASKLN